MWLRIHRSSRSGWSLRCIHRGIIILVSVLVLLCPVVASALTLSSLSSQITNTDSKGSEPSVLIAEVNVQSKIENLPENLIHEVYQAISTKPGQTTRRSQLREDINAIFATGYFSNVTVFPEDTPLGVRVTFQVEPNPLLQRIRLEGATLETLQYQDNEISIYQAVDNIFTSQYNQILNSNTLQSSISQLEELYRNNGYVLAQVINMSEISSHGIITLNIAEGVIGDIKIRFLDEDKNAVDENGNSIQGITPEDEILSEIESKRGTVFEQSRITADIQRVYNLGISRDVKFELQPFRDSHKVSVILQIIDEQVTEWHPWTKDVLKVFNAIDSRNYVEAISQYETLLHFFQQQRSNSLVAFTLNNLANLSKQVNDYNRAIRYYQQASPYFQKLKSPILSAFTLINLASVYNSQQEPAKAISAYQQALALVRSAQQQIKQNQVSDPLILDVLGNTNTENTVKYIHGLLNLEEVLLTFDIATSYSALGDHQQALYLVTNSQFLENVRYAEELWQNIAGQLIAISNLDEFQRELAEFTPIIGKLLAKIPDIIQPLVLRFIYTDFGDEIRIQNYNQKSQQEFQEFLEILRSSLITVNTDTSPWMRLAVSGVNFALKQHKTRTDIDRLSQQIIYLSRQFLRDKFTQWEPYLKVSVPVFLNTFANLADDQQTLALFNQLLNTWRSVSLPQIQLKSELSWAQPLLNMALSDGKNLVEGALISGLGNVYLNLEQHQAAIAAYENAIQTIQVNPKIAQQQISDAQQNFGSLLELFSPLIQSFVPVLTDLMQQPFSIDLERVQQEVSDVHTRNHTHLQQLLQNREKLEQILQTAQLLLTVVQAHTQVNALASLANVYLDLGQLENAREVYYRALEFSFLNEGSLQKSQIQYGLAHVEMILGNLSEAKTLLHQAIQTLEDHPPTASNIFAGQFTKAEMNYGYDTRKGSLSAGIGFSSKGIVDKVLSGSSIPIFGKTCERLVNYFTCKQQYFDLYIDILWQLHQQNPQQGYDRLAFSANERYRAGTADLFQLVRAKQMQDLSETSQPGSHVSNSSPPSPSTATSRPQDFEFLEKILPLNRPAEFAEISSLLDEDTLLLEYFLGEKRSYLWVVSANGALETYPLEKRSVIEEKAKAFYDMLTIPENRQRPKRTAEVGLELSHALLDPIVPQLRERIQRLVIVSDGILQYIPFSALPNPALPVPSNSTTNQRTFAQRMRPLLLDHEITNSPSASVLARIRLRHPDRPSASKELAIFANPVFNHEDQRSKELLSHLDENLDSSTSIFRMTVPTQITTVYSPLPGTKEEMNRIIQAVAENSQAQYQSYEGFDARYDLALGNNLSQYRIVHFATHGIFNNRSPERSGIVLSALNQKGELQRGLLSPADAFRLHIPATDLVVLSGCRTGWSSEIRREALAGLTGGLMSAGAERVVVSLWSVQDQATAELMARFYKAMENPQHPLPASKALVEAQRSMWRESQWQEPYYWAAFTLQGEWN
jgi:CHAT domain-containing protein/tetratricopeptide (TPR) repeat protein